jgi:hypothetical protein
MDIKELKKSIETDTLGSISVCIFHNADATAQFVSNQYINEISSRLELPINYIDSIDSYTQPTIGLFDEVTSNTLNVYRCDEFNCYSDLLFDAKNLIIVTNSMDKDTTAKFDTITVNFPKLLNWQITDYVYSMLPAISKKDLDWMISLCNYDIYRLQSEIDKISLFDEAVQAQLFNNFISDNVFGDLCEFDVFKLVNSIVKKDIDSLSKIYSKLDKIDISEFGLLTLLYNNFKNIINVQLSVNPTPESVGLKPNQFNAVRYNCGKYSKEQLIKILGVISSIDKKIKTGEIDLKFIVDYLILKILTI